MHRRHSALRVVVVGLVVLALTSGPWVALQTVAWARMLVRYSQQDGLVAGVTKTFDGQHPCSLCHKIQKAQVPTTKKAPAPASSNEVNWFAILNEVALSVPPLAHAAFSIVDEIPPQLVERPPIPPPKFSRTV